MTQNIYDDPGFFEGYGRLSRSVKGLAGAPEWPALRALLPDVKGLRIVDLGCGFGWFCRWAREQGAAHVLGVDMSQRMLERAKATTTDPAIVYRRVNLEHIELPAAAFDLAYSSLTLHYLPDLNPLFAKVHRVLMPGSRFVFTIEHPIYMASRHPHWTTDGEGRQTWPVDSYQLEGRRTTSWLAEGVVKYHRTIGTTLNLLIGNGFAIRHVEEWGPTDSDLAAMPALAEERDRPMMMLVAAER